MHKIPLGVLPQDEKEAELLNAACIYCAYQERAARKAGLTIHAEFLKQDYQNAKRDLDQLRAKKAENDRIVSMVQDLKNRGIEVTKIERVILHVR